MPVLGSGFVEAGKALAPRLLCLSVRNTKRALVITLPGLAPTLQKDLPVFLPFLANVFFSLNLRRKQNEGKRLPQQNVFRGCLNAPELIVSG